MKRGDSDDAESEVGYPLSVNTFGLTPAHCAVKPVAEPTVMLMLFGSFTLTALSSLSPSPL